MKKEQKQERNKESMFCRTLINTESEESLRGHGSDSADRLICGAFPISLDKAAAIMSLVVERIDTVTEIWTVPDRLD